ncbi:MAG: class II fructose-bisphosphate aldolase, partial [Candidatus Colwellbacteria bacterium]|nr:class II fructose-bisphosphate aldolase [Candidatus Colwellbacteria bacterium]
MIVLRDIIRDAAEKKIAVGHFNFSDLAGFRAIVRAASELKLPVILGVSEGEREFVGVETAAHLVARAREEYAPSFGAPAPFFLNADHTRSLEKAEEAVRAGFDAVLLDGSKLPMEENIRATREAVARLKELNPDLIVEGELGYIGEASRLLRELPEGASLTSAEEAREFVRETGVDLFAPAVGNIHGMLVNAPNPQLHIQLIAEIREASGVPLVLHGGSGIRDGDFTEAIQAGVSVIHVNTELRHA